MCQRDQGRGRRVPGAGRVLGPGGFALMLGALVWLRAASAGGGGPNVAVWGDLGYAGLAGSPTPQADLTNAVADAGGVYHVLALRADGGVEGWGNDLYGCLDVPPQLTNALAVAAGYYDSVVLQGGVVTAWGYNYWGSYYGGQTNVPANLTNAVAIAAGAAHVLALRCDGSVVAWGDNTDYWWNPSGQTDVPAGLTNAVAVAAGYFFSLALRADGTVVAWGDNGYGQTNVPAGLTNAVAIAGGPQHAIALRADGTVVGWGDNRYGQTSVPADLTNAIAIAAGGGHTLALRADGTVTAWGANNVGQTNVPAGLTNVVAIGAAGAYSVAVTNAAPVPQHVLVTNVALRGRRLSVRVPTQRGRVYGLEYSQSLGSPQWVLLPLIAGTGSPVDLVDPGAGAGQRFYRVRRW